MGTGLYSQNGILTNIALNFYLVNDAWSRVAGFVGTSFAILILSLILPNSSTMELNVDNKIFTNDEEIVSEQTLNVRIVVT